jgi:hypothetical protein
LLNILLLLVAVLVTRLQVPDMVVVVVLEDTVTR